MYVSEMTNESKYNYTNDGNKRIEETKAIIIVISFSIQFKF